MSGENPGSGTETKTIPCKCDDAKAEVSGKMDETANPRGCKLEIGIKSIPESPGCFWKRIAECRLCKYPSGSFLSLTSAGNFCRNRRELIRLTHIKK